MGMMVCVECGTDYKQTSDSRFCSYRCKRAFTWKATVAAFECQGNPTPEWYKMSRKEQNKVVRAWRDTIRQEGCNAVTG